MITAISLTVDKALMFAKISTDPILIVDNSINILNHADALVQLGAQLVAIHMTDITLYNHANTPISLTDFFALAPKSSYYDNYNRQRNGVYFTEVTGSLQDFINNEAALATAYQLDGYTLPDGTHFQVLFANPHTVSTTIIIDATAAINSGIALSKALNACLWVDDTGANIIANADALVQLSATLGTQLNLITANDGNLSAPISLNDFLILAPQTFTTDWVGIFDQVTGSLEDFVNNEAALAALSAHFDGYTLTDGTHFQIAFAYGGIIASITMDATTAIRSGSLIATTLNTPIHVVDTGANIIAHADELIKLGSKLYSVVASDNFDNLNIPTHLSDFLVWAPKIMSVFTQVTGSIQDFINNEATLATLSSELGGYTLLDGTHFQATFASNQTLASITVDVVTALKSGALLSNILNAPIRVVDTTANVVAHMDELVKLGVQHYTISDNGGYNFSSPISLNDFLTLANNTTGFNGNPLMFDQVIGSLQDFINNEAALATLSSELGDYTLPDGTHFQATFASDQTLASITVDVATAIRSATVLITGLGIASVNIMDTVDNIVSHADALTKLGNQLNSIETDDNMVDAPISLNDFLVLAPKTIDTFGYPTFNQVTGSLQDFINNEGTLATLSWSLGGYTLADGTHFQVNFASNHTVATVILDVATASHSGNLLSTELNAPIQVLDTAANIAVYGDALAKLGSSLLSVQVIDEMNIIDFLKFSQANGHPASLNTLISVDISDGSDYIQANLDKLEANAQYIRNIYFNDDRPPTLTFNNIQWVKDADVISKIVAHYQLAFTYVNVSVWSSILNNAHVTLPVTVLDGALSIFSVLDSFQAHLDKINQITLANSAVDPVIYLNAAQYHADQSALAKISADGNQYNLHITNETVAQLQNDLTDTHVSYVNLTDSASNIFSNIASLLAVKNQLQLITLNDTTVPTEQLTASQYWADRAVLSHIVNSAYQLSISGESVVRALNDEGNSHITAVSIADSVGSVLNHLDALQADKQLTSISLTDSGVPTIAITAKQFNSDVTVLNAIQSPYHLSIKDTASALNHIDLTTLDTTHATIELMPTTLDTTIKINSYISDLNLSALNMKGATIMESADGQNGTEVVIAKNGHVESTMIFTQESEAQLHIIGVDPVIIHTV